MKLHVRRPASATTSGLRHWRVLNGAVETLRGGGGLIEEFVACCTEGHGLPILPIPEIGAALDADAIVQDNGQGRSGSSWIGTGRPDRRKVGP